MENFQFKSSENIIYIYMNLTIYFHLLEVQLKTSKASDPTKAPYKIFEPQVASSSSFQ